MGHLKRLLHSKFGGGGNHISNVKSQNKTRTRTELNRNSKETIQINKEWKAKEKDFRIGE